MSQLIQFKRGLKADLPSSAYAGEPLFTTDTNELYIGTGLGIVPVVGVDENVKVGAAGTKDYLSSSYFEQDSTNHIRILQSTLLSGVNVDKVDGKDVDDGQNTTSYLWTAGKIISYVQQFAMGLDWQNSVLSIAATEPSTPATGARYIVGVGATGTNFAGQDDKIAEWNGTAWVFTTPNPGFATYNEGNGFQYTYNGAAWVNFGSTTNHNATSGLQGGTTAEYYHLTSAQHSGLTGGGTTTLHGHNTDDLTEGITNLFFTDALAVAALEAVIGNTNSITFTESTSSITADVNVAGTDSIALTIGATGITADLNIADTNTVDLSIGLTGLTADVSYQATNSVTLGSDAAGLKADINVANTDSVSLSVGLTGLVADVNVADTDSIDFTIGLTGITADVKVDNASLKIDATNHYVYVDVVDGGTF